MTTDDQSAAQTAAAYAERAAALASTLKPGNYEAVQALALVSIAQSLAILANHPRPAA